MPFSSLVKIFAMRHVLALRGELEVDCISVEDWSGWHVMLKEPRLVFLEKPAEGLWRHAHSNSVIARSGCVSRPLNRPQSHFSFSFFPQGVCLKLCLSPFVLSTLMGLETLGTEIPLVIWCRCAHTLIASLWRSFPRWGWELREDVFMFGGA